MAERKIVIEDPSGTRRVAVTERAYRETAIDEAGHTYLGLHWRIVKWNDGEPYLPPSRRPDPAPDAPAPALRTPRRNAGNG
jgi:hypothetical protein